MSVLMVMLKQFFINLVCNNYSVFVVLQLLTVALREF